MIEGISWNSNHSETSEIIERYVEIRSKNLLFKIKVANYDRDALYLSRCIVNYYFKTILFYIDICSALFLFAFHIGKSERD